jgi:hypothetical protein
MTSRESVVFYKSFYDAIKGLDAENYKKCCNAILEYAFEGKEPIKDSVEYLVFTLVKPQIDKNNTRYENSKKGGNPNFKKGQKNPYYNNQEITKTLPKDNQEITSQLPNVYVYDNVNDNVYVNANVNDNVNVYDNDNVNDIKLTKKIKNKRKPTELEIENMSDEEFIKYLGGE